MGVLGVERRFVPQESPVKVRPSQVSRGNIQGLLGRVFNMEGKYPCRLDVATPLGDYSLGVPGLTIYYKEIKGGLACEFSARVELPARLNKRGFNVADKREISLMEQIMTATAEHVLSQISSKLEGHRIDIGVFPLSTTFAEEPEKAWHDPRLMKAFVLAGRITAE